MFNLVILCAALFIAVVLLACKIALDRRTLREIQDEMNYRLEHDTNTLISISGADRQLRRFAGALNIQLKRLRDERRKLQNGDRELKEAVANISHDLRTPLTAICGYMELLAREELPKPTSEYLDIISNRVEALKQLTEELMQYAIASSANSYAIREEVVLNSEIEACVAAYYGALIEQGIAPEISLPEAPVKRLLNRAALSRILGNVMINALRYSDGDLRISLSENAEIIFSNRASCLDDVTAERLFDRFYTVENGRNSTGLGLSIAKALTERLGGSIGAKKENGTFVISLRFCASDDRSRPGD